MSPLTRTSVGCGRGGWGGRSGLGWLPCWVPTHHWAVGRRNAQPLAHHISQYARASVFLHPPDVILKLIALVALLRVQQEIRCGDMVVLSCLQRAHDLLGWKPAHHCIQCKPATVASAGGTTYPILSMMARRSSSCKSMFCAHVRAMCCQLCVKFERSHKISLPARCCKAEAGSVHDPRSSTYG